MKESKVLSVVIPTYNRASYLDKQISWAEVSIDGFWDKVELIVCNNASTDETRNVCNKWQARLGAKINIVENLENIGLVKNCLKGIEVSTSNYVWLVGDDDPILKYAVGKLVNILEKNNSYALMHINHRCLNGETGKVLIEKFYEKDASFSTVAKDFSSINAILDETHTGGFMFITANILNRNRALEFIKGNPPKEQNILSYPLFLNLYLALNGPFYFVSDCLVDCVYNQSSWVKKLNHLYFVQIPQVLLELRKYGLSNKVVKYGFDFHYRELKSTNYWYNQVRVLKLGAFNSSLLEWIKYKFYKFFYQTKLKITS